jgi:DNA-binding response OmpR family regulator
MRVLLIEDDSATAQSIELMLKSEGFNVYTTDLGEEGIDLGKVYDYDIILLDLNLPGYVRLRGPAQPARHKGEDTDTDTLWPSRH